jgi:hypothetical protein
MAHFVGLHALQVLPLLGWLLGRATRLPGGIRLVLIVTAGLAYLGVVVVLTWQALCAQSVIAPDALTRSALGLIIGLTGVVSIITVARGLMNATGTANVSSVAAPA